MKTRLGDWEDSTQWCIGVSSWASYKTKILKVPSEPLKREQIKIVYVLIYNRSFLVNINSSIAYKNV